MKKINVLAPVSHDQDIPKRARTIIAAALTIDPGAWAIKRGSQDGDYRLTSIMTDGRKICIDIKTIVRNPLYDTPVLRLDSISLGNNVPRQNLDLTELNFDITCVSTIVEETLAAIHSIIVIDHKMLDEIEGMISYDEFIDKPKSPFQRLAITAMAPIALQAAQDPKSANKQFLVVSRHSNKRPWIFEYTMGGMRPDNIAGHEHLNITPMTHSEDHSGSLYTHAPLITLDLNYHNVIDCLRYARAFDDFVSRYAKER